MKKHRRRLGLTLATTSILVLWLFVGAFRDRESSTVYLFMKHRPSPKVIFFAPLGESDKRIEDLPLHLQKEERAFADFVYSGGGYSRKITLWQ